MVNVGRAKTELSKLIARAENGEEVEIARDGVPVVRLVPIERKRSPGEKLLAARGSLAGQIRISPDFEYTEAELDEIYNNPL